MSYYDYSDSSCNAPTFTDIATEGDPFGKLQKLLSAALKGHSKEQQVLEFLGNLRDVSRNFNAMTVEERQKYAADFVKTAKDVVDSIKGELMQKALISKIQDPKNWILIVIPVLIFIFAFICYRLYKTMTERERKRVEKQLAKEAKKKK